MQAARHAAALPQLGFALVRPITNLKDLLPCLSQRLSFATHGVSDGAVSKEGGVPRFYKTVNVKEALDQVRHRCRRRQPLLLLVLHWLLPHHRGACP